MLRLQTVGHPPGMTEYGAAVLDRAASPLGAYTAAGIQQTAIHIHVTVMSSFTLLLTFVVRRAIASLTTSTALLSSVVPGGLSDR